MSFVVLELALDLIPGEGPRLAPFQTIETTIQLFALGARQARRAPVLIREQLVQAIDHILDAAVFG